ncbi:MAG: alpha/beta fold hydrolase [Gammaproteobacteria bacterium]|nr:alpha/beta fold hydrolase [Gammaproteobacteria bacterium]
MTTEPRRIVGLVLRSSLGAIILIVLATALILITFSWQADLRETRTAAQAAPTSGRFVHTGDVDLFIQEMGPTTGPAVLFVHGTGAWSETWRESMATLAAAGFRAIALDLPPFGFSGRPNDSSYDKPAQARRIVGVLDALQISRAILVGHSFGGGPTMEAAFAASARINALVLVDVALGLDTGVQKPSAIMRGFLTLPSLREAVVATFLTNPLFTRRLLGFFIADIEHATRYQVGVYQRPLRVQGTTAAVGAWLPTLMLPQPAAASDDAARYRALGVPTLIVWGNLDSITPPAQGRHLAGLIPGAQLTIMNDVGHIPQIEDTRRFNALLVEFVTKLNVDP